MDFKYCETCQKKTVFSDSGCLNCNLNTASSEEKPTDEPEDPTLTQIMATKKAINEKQTKACKFCGEKVLLVAIKCKHCGSGLGKNTKPTADYGLALLIIPAAAMLLMFLWVPSLRLIDNPTQSLVLIALALTISTATIAAMEAKNAGAVSDREKGTYSPLEWFFIISLLWVIGYPAYMAKRAKYGLKNKLFASLIIVVFTVFITLLVGSMIEARQEEIRSDLHDLQRQLDSFGRYK